MSIQNNFLCRLPTPFFYLLFDQCSFMSQLEHPSDEPYRTINRNYGYWYIGFEEKWIKNYVN